MSKNKFSYLNGIDTKNAKTTGICHTLQSFTNTTDYEYDLEKELLTYNNSILEETKEFEDSLGSTNDFMDENSDCGELFNEYVYPKYLTNYLLYFQINKTSMNYIKNVYLEIDVGESFYNLSKEEVYDLFEICVEMYNIDEHIKVRILTLLIQQIMLGRRITEMDNKLQIPILNLNNGYSALSIRVFINNCKMPMRLLISRGCKKIKSDDILEILELRSIVSLYSSDTSFTYNINHITCVPGLKGLFVYLTSIEDVPVPVIKKIKLEIGHFEPLEYENENLISIDILGVCVYIVPFCEDLYNIGKIKLSIDKLKSVETLPFNNYSAYISFESDDEKGSYGVCVSSIFTRVS
jgi:hypothetical protein